MKTTLVIGASENPERYAYKVIRLLLNAGHPVKALSNRSGKIEHVEFMTNPEHLKDIDTITLYLSAENQAKYTDYIIELQPRRVIFNPGTENPTFQHELQQAGIEALEACTLVMLSTGQY